MGNRFRYKLDKRCRYYTAGTIVLTIAIFAVLCFSTVSGYLPAWFLSIALALIALCMLSIPRFVRTTSEAVEIHCLVEITIIPVEEIRSVRPVTQQELRRIYLLLGAYGFFGYFGYYLDLNNWDIVKVYASSWNYNQLVMIEDIYEQRYLISATQPAELCASIEKRRLAHRSRESQAI